MMENSIKPIIASIIVGAVFTSLVFAPISYLFIIKDHSGGFLPLSSWWILGVLVATVLGAMVGGISAAIIAIFDLGMIKAVILSGTINSSIFLALYIIEFGRLSFGPKYSLLSLIPIGLLNGAVVSWFVTSTSQTLK